MKNHFFKMKQFRKDKKLYIKIHKTKFEWIKSFLDKTESLDENEFLYKKYTVPEKIKKTELYKGLYDEKSDEVRIVYIFQQERYLNQIIKFYGTIEDINSELFLVGNAYPIHINYWKELYKVPGVWMIIPFLIIGMIIQKSFIQDFILVFLFISVGFSIIPKIEARNATKKLIRWLETI